MARSLDTGSVSVSRRELLLTSGVVGIGTLAGCTTSGGASTEDGDSGNQDSKSGDTELSGEINIAGSSTVFPLAMAVAEKFQKKHPGVTITVQSTGTGGGFNNFFCVGKTDFNNASRPITESEKKLCAENGVKFIELKIATDALTVVVSNEADWIDCLTVGELKQIYKPNPVEKWSDLRSEWPDKEIARYGAAETSGTFDYFTETIIGEEGTHTQDYQPTEKDNIIVQGVQGNPYAIGYFGFAYYYNNPDQVKAVAIDSGNGCVKPSLETARSGKYPLSRPLFTYPARSSLKERHIAEFARFYVQQSANQKLVANQVGYVPNTKSEMQNQLEKLSSAIEEIQ